MPKESVLRKKVVEILEKNGWITWYPSKTKYKQNDIFGIIDLLAIKGRQKKNIQITTSSNTAERRKKIVNFLKNFKIEMLVEIWSWNQKKKMFKKEKINIKLKKNDKTNKSSKNKKKTFLCP